MNATGKVTRALPASHNGGPANGKKRRRAARNMIERLRGEATPALAICVKYGFSAFGPYLAGGAEREAARAVLAERARN